MKPDPTPEEGEGTREKKNRMVTALRAAGIKEEVYLQKPGGRKSKGKRPEAWMRRAKRTWPWRCQGRKESLPQGGRKGAKPSKPRRKPEKKWQWHLGQKKPPPKGIPKGAARSEHQEEPWKVQEAPRRKTSRHQWLAWQECPESPPAGEK